MSIKLRLNTPKNKTVKLSSQDFKPLKTHQLITKKNILAFALKQKRLRLEEEKATQIFALKQERLRLKKKKTTQARAHRWVPQVLLVKKFKTANKQFEIIKKKKTLYTRKGLLVSTPAMLRFKTEGIKNSACQKPKLLALKFLKAIAQKAKFSTGRAAVTITARPFYLKKKINTYDRLFYYYTIKTPLSLYAHKAFILLEMQLNASLVRIKLVPYLFIVKDLCFYRIIEVNGLVVSSPYHILSRYDSVSIPIDLHNYMYYRSYRVQYYPAQLANFFKHYWMQFTNYNQNKVGLLTNFLISNVTAEAVIFDYPNVVSYMNPFREFTNLYFRNQPYSGNPEILGDIAFSHSVIRLKLFTYAAFYKPN